MHVVQHVSKSLCLHWLTLGVAIMECYVIEIWKLLQLLPVWGILDGKTVGRWLYAVSIAV
jgi:hypothetical protein